MIRSFGRFLSRHRRSLWVRQLDTALVKLHKSIENCDYNLDRNGERWVIERISSTRPVRTAFDVGANVGDWTQAALQHFPSAAIHAFEIAPETFRVLRAQTIDCSRVVANNLGLSDEVGVIDLHFDPNKSGLATAVAGFAEHFHGYEPQRLALPVTTGDQYCQEKGISRIELLKIDVEGHEPSVLRGFEKLLGEGSIDAVQFEYGFVNAHVGFLLKDFHELFARFDMRVGKIYPNHVDFRPYGYADENFYGPNYLAVRESDTELIEALEAP